MWVVIRLGAIVVAFVARYLRRLFPRDPAGYFEGKPYYQKLRKSKRGTIQGFRIGATMRVPVTFRLQIEGAPDRFFKALGLADEVQVGDSDFDEEVYVA